MGLTEDTFLSFIADTSYFSSIPSYTYLNNFHTTFEHISSKEDSLHSLLFQKKIALIYASNGLNFSGQVYYRPNNSFRLDEDEVYSIYNAKFQAEIGWNYFESSFFNRSGKIKEIKIRGEMDKAISKGKQLTENYALLKNCIKQAHDSIISGLLFCRMENLQLLYKSQQQLLGKKKINGKFLLEIMNQYFDVERKFNTSGGIHKYPKHLFPVSPSILYVDTVALFHDMENLSIDIQVFKLKEKFFEHQIDNLSYWDNVTIRPFVRFSHYTGSNLKSPSNIDLGVNFRFPLSAENRKKRKMMEVEKNMQTSYTESIYKSIKTSTSLLINDIACCNQACKNEYTQIKELYRCLLERKEGYTEYIGEYSYPSRLQEYNMYIEALEHLQELLLKRDLLLISLQELYPGASIFDYCRYILF